MSNLFMKNLDDPECVKLYSLARSNQESSQVPNKMIVLSRPELMEKVERSEWQ